MSWKILLLLLVGTLVVSLVRGIDKSYFSICIGQILPKISGLPKNITVTQGKTFSIICNAESCFGDQMRYQWLDPQGRDLSKMKGFSVKGGLLTIFNVQQNAEGNYTCKVADEYGADQASLTLRVQVPPKIVQFENLLIREENASATFKCKARGVPKPNVGMRKDRTDGPIQSGDGRIKLVEYDEGDLKVVQLTIVGVKRSDEGLYSCQASNGAGLDVKAGRLEVQFGPDMSPTPAKVVKAWSANPGNLTCIAVANPKASLAWKFRGAPINQSDERYQIIGNQSQSSLLVRTDDHEGFGEYTCEAENRLGINSTTILLEKALAPGPVAKIFFFRVTPTTVTFYFQQPADTGGLPINNYIMKYKLSSDPQEKTVTIGWTRGSVYILRDLTPRRKYHFSVAAGNDVGLGPWKDTEYIMPQETPPERPTIVTKPGTVSRYPDRFEVRWEVPSISGGKPVTAFEVRYFKVKRCDSGWLPVDQPAKRVLCFNWTPTPSVELTGLQPDSFYKIQIRAVNKVGKSLPRCVVVRTGRAEESHVLLSKTTYVVLVVFVLLFILLGALVEVLVGKSLVKLSMKTLENCQIMKRSTEIIKSMFGKREARPVADHTRLDIFKKGDREFFQGDVPDQKAKQACEISYIVI